MASCFLPNTDSFLEFFAFECGKTFDSAVDKQEDMS